MTQSLRITIKPSIFDRVRQLIINKDFVEYDDKDLSSAAATIFLKNDIAGLKYGIKWIKGYRFTIGRIYCIYICNKKNEIIKIRLKSIYGVRKAELFEKYSKIVKVLYASFINDISRNYFQQFSAGTELNLAGIRLTQTGVFLKEKSDMVAWMDIEIKAYVRYYDVYSISNPAKHKIIEYFNEWESGILYGVLQQVLKEKGYK
jgi:hypothetical protein